MKKTNSQGLNVCDLSQRLYNTMEKHKEVFYYLFYFLYKTFSYLPGQLLMHLMGQIPYKISDRIVHSNILVTVRFPFIHVKIGGIL